MDPEDVAPLRFGPAVSPHLAAALAGKRIDAAALVEHAVASAGDTLIVEGVGGLLVPLTERLHRARPCRRAEAARADRRPTGPRHDQSHAAHVEAARAVGLSVAAVVLTPWPAEPSQMEQSNMETIARLGEVEVATLRVLQESRLGELAESGDSLPWRAWL